MRGLVRSPADLVRERIRRMPRLELAVGMMEIDHEPVAPAKVARSLDELAEDCLAIGLDAEVLASEAARPLPVDLLNRSEVPTHTASLTRRRSTDSAEGPRSCRWMCWATLETFS